MIKLIIVAYFIVALFHAVNFDAQSLTFKEKSKNFFAALAFPAYWIYSLVKKIVLEVKIWIANKKSKSDY